MTAPDTDVRPLCRPTPARAGGAGRFALARLLLRVLQTVRQLDRKLILLFATSLLPACIIPVGPEFQDPPGVANSPPQIFDPQPFWGAEVPATPTGATFTFTVSDLNGDGMFIRFLVDGGTVEISNNRVAPSDPASPARQPVTNQISCQILTSEASRLKSRHAVLAAVADRMFDLGVEDPLTVPAPGLYTPITWTLNMTCPVSPGSP
jgi:hypothetical protein